MWKRMTAIWLVGLSLVAWPAVSVVAAPIKFDFTFKQGPATAIGFITFESTLFANPGVNNFSLPNPAVLDLQVKVTGAAAGNGTFGIASFDGVFLNTGGSALNLGNELVGQPVVAGPWGTNCNGDFNLFSPAAPIPTGVECFLLGANHGSAEAMQLVSMTAAPVGVPTLGAVNLLLLAIIVAGVGIVVFRYGRDARRIG